MTESTSENQGVRLAAPGERAEDTIYQGNPPRQVARVLEPEVDWGTKQIRFSEIYQSDELVLADECEFQKYRVMIQRVEFASRVDKGAPDKGRVLRGVVAEILGYREQ
jgi:hypothetical protein